MKTLIISAFPGCGKTWMYKHQDALTFGPPGESREYSFIDSDSSKFNRCESWEKSYADYIESNIGKVDFIFISQHDAIRQELEARGIPYVTVAPDNCEWTSKHERQLIKQQWFGRFLLRDNSHIRNINDWMVSMKEHYDEWTSSDHLMLYGAVTFFTLRENQYLQDIITDLYWMKETNAKFTERKNTAYFRK